VLRPVVLVLSCAALVAACSDTPGDPSTVGVARPSTSTDRTLAERAIGDVVDGQAFPAERCSANRAAGTLRVATDGADTSASARLSASTEGFAALCIDVELIPSTSTANYIDVAAQQVQLAIATSIVELADYAGRNDAQFVAIDILPDGSTLYTTAEFVNTYPAAAQDIVRAWRHTVEAADPAAAAAPIDIDAAEAALDAAQDSISGPIPRAGDLITTSLVAALVDPTSSTLIWPKG
jgi:hypothetical protein